MRSDAADGPSVPDVGVLAFVPDRWEIPWQLRHQVLTRLARYFHVVWVTPPTPWRDQLRSWRAHGPTAERSAGADRPGFTVFRPPVWLPAIGRPARLEAWADETRLRQARRLLETRGCTRIVAYLWRPAFASVLDRLPHDVSCYHIDDEYSFSDVEGAVDPAEARLIGRVDEVFIHSPALLEKKGHLNPSTTFVPNGVDFQAFATPTGEPSDLAVVPHPRIGYVGRIKRQLDLQLVRTLAERHPDWSFVMVGPVEHVAEIGPAMATLSRLPNVYLLGPRPVEQLPAYTQHLDVCTLWYQVNGYTKFIYPLKLHEYLASGRPVVSSPIDSLRAFDEVVRLARTPEEWSTALTDSLNETASSPDLVDRRQRTAREHDWSRPVSTIAKALTRRLARRIGPGSLGSAAQNRVEYRVAVP